MLARHLAGNRQGDDPVVVTPLEGLGLAVLPEHERHHLSDEIPTRDLYLRFAYPLAEKVEHRHPRGAIGDPPDDASDTTGPPIDLAVPVQRVVAVVLAKEPQHGLSRAVTAL